MVQTRAAEDPKDTQILKSIRQGQGPDTAATVVRRKSMRAASSLHDALWVHDRPRGVVLA